MVDTAGNQLPYIDYQNERYINENEIRILKMVNGEVDYKAQSLTMEVVPQLLDGAESGGYSVDIRPGVEMGALSFMLLMKTRPTEVFSVIFVSVKLCL